MIRSFHGDSQNIMYVDPWIFLVVVIVSQTDPVGDSWSSLTKMNSPQKDQWFRSICLQFEYLNSWNCFPIWNSQFWLIISRDRGRGKPWRACLEVLIRREGALEPHVLLRIDQRISEEATRPLYATSERAFNNCPDCNSRLWIVVAGTSGICSLIV